MERHLEYAGTIRYARRKLSQAAQSVFDTPDALEIVKARWEAVRVLLTDLRQQLNLETAIDVGCGIGHFSQLLLDLGFRVRAVDGREQNIAEAKVRYPAIEFSVANVEDDSLTRLGSFDLVFCMGLLYHLENPLLGVRKLQVASRVCLLLESMCIPDERPLTLLREEPRHDNQSLTNVAFYPTESCLAKMLYRAGFSQVYRLAVFPDHDDFRETDDHKRRRTVLLAAKVPFSSSLLRALPEPVESPDPWAKAGKRRPLVFRMVGFLRKPLHEQYQSFYSHWRSVFPNAPVPVRLPFGAWFVARGDALGSSLTYNGFEPAEGAFLEKFLQPGMTVLDIGAHQGLYTLLAAKKVGPDGRVYSFEPSPREQKALLFNVRLNRCRNVRVQALALGNADGSASLYVVNGPNTGCNSLRPPNLPDRTCGVAVRIQALDNWLAEQNVNRVDFIKLDVEGGELDVLKGAERTLQTRPRPVILCEIENVRTAPWGYKAEEIVRHLSGLGYSWFRATCAGSLQSLPKTGYVFEGNYIAVPEERFQELTGRVANGNCS